MNSGIHASGLPPILKQAEVKPIKNYRPASLLVAISKVYERLLYKQVSDYFERRLSKYQCDFRKSYSAQNCLLLMVEK